MREKDIRVTGEEREREYEKDRRETRKQEDTGCFLFVRFFF